MPCSTTPASRRRIVEAADVQRRRIVGELAEAVETRLDAANRLLEEVRADDEPASALLDAVVAELRDARAELTEFARGIHPRTLTEGGLGTALPALVRRAGLQVELNVQPGRLAPPIEAAVYYVCSEALTNVAKHARARRVAIEIRWPRDQVTVIIEDDWAGAWR